MEFTEVQELNNITSIARSLQVRQLLPEAKSSFSQYRAPSVKPAEGTQIFDYEKALQDTPPDSPNKRYIAQIAQAKPNPNIVLGEREESIEEILKAIQNTIIYESEMVQVSLGISNRIPKKESPRKAEDINVESPKRKEESPDRKEEDQLQLKLGLNDFGNKNFEKMRGDEISKSYIETKNIKSFLSTSIKAFPMGSRQESSPIKRGDVKTYRVYFLTEKHSTLIPLTISSPISEIIKQCLEMFKLNKTINELLKYPDRPDAYELKKDNQTPPLDRQKTLRDLRIAKELIVAEVENFDASKPVGEGGNSKDAGKNEKNYTLNIVIYLPTDDKATLQVQMNSERLVKDIFSRLALEGKAGYNQTNFNIRVYNSDPEARWKEAKNFLDANYPLKSVKPTNNKEIIELELVKKKFADEPTEPLIDHRKTSISPKKRAGTVDITLEVDDQIILYNEVSANHYEEFEVVKINETGKRQDRILGIDGFKLYNYSKSYKQEQTGGIGDMINTFFFSKFGTMNPERLLTDVLGAKLINSKVFQITVIADAKEKYMSFEAKESRTAKQIVAKINYLKMLQAKKLNA